MELDHAPSQKKKTKMMAFWDTPQWKERIDEAALLAGHEKPAVWMRRIIRAATLENEREAKRKPAPHTSLT